MYIFSKALSHNIWLIKIKPICEHYKYNNRANTNAFKKVIFKIDNFPFTFLVSSYSSAFHP